MGSRGRPHKTSVRGPTLSKRLLETFVPKGLHVESDSRLLVGVALLLGGPLGVWPFHQPAKGSSERVGGACWSSPTGLSDVNQGGIANLKVCWGGTGIRVST